MKAKVIKTGEIIDITIYKARFGGPEGYWDSKNKKEYLKSELDFNIDTQMSKETIDWEQRRYEIAKDAIAGILVKTVNPDLNTISICKLAVTLADTLIKELKKKK